MMPFLHPSRVSYVSIFELLPTLSKFGSVQSNRISYSSSEGTHFYHRTFFPPLFVESFPSSRLPFPSQLLEGAFFGRFSNPPTAGWVLEILLPGTRQLTWASRPPVSFPPLGSFFLSRLVPFSPFSPYTVSYSRKALVNRKSVAYYAPRRLLAERLL